MRTCMVTVLALAVAVTAFAQGFIPQAEQDARKKELMGAAQKLLGSGDSHERAQLLKDMVEKDTIKDAAGKALGDGFAVDAFAWLYRQGLQQDDVNARLIAVIGLTALNAAAARDPLVEALNGDPAEAIQLRAVQAVERKAVARAGKDVVMKLRSPSPEVAAAAARCLATLNYDPQNQTAGAMVEIMAQTYDKLMQMPGDDPARGDYQRLLEIVGQSCAKLITTVAWAPGQSLEDLGREVAKFTAWWNAKHLPGLKDAKFETRRDALAQMTRTADRSAFGAILDAVQKEVERLRAPGDFPEKQLALQFVVNGSAMLSRISALPDTALRPTSSPDDMTNAVKAWQTWLTAQPK